MAFPEKTALFFVVPELLGVQRLPDKIRRIVAISKKGPVCQSFKGCAVRPERP